MPKPREDLQYVQYRIDAAIRDGRATAVPIYPLNSEWSELGRWPSTALNLESIRLRMPPLYADSRAKYEARFERPWDNRSTIKPCVLNSRFVAVTNRSSDYDYLLQATLEERRAVGVIETARGLKRRIYEIVTDLSHGLRQPVHIRVQYEEERAKLQTIRLEIRERLRRQGSGFLNLTAQEQETADLTAAQISYRLVEIDRILADRVVREMSLRSYAQRSNLELFFLAQSLANFTGSLGRMPRFNSPAVAGYLRRFVSDLAMFGSREVRPYRNYAKNLIKRVLDDILWLERLEITRLLEKAVEHLIRAANIMSGWADNLKQDEKTIANLVTASVEP